MTDITTLNLRDFDGMDMGAGHAPALVEKLNELVAGVNASGDVVFPPVADLAALKAIAADDLADKMLVLCETLGLYRYDSASAATPDDVGVVRPTAATGNGRFLRIYKSLMPIPETGKKYVDATLGSDTTGDGSINKPFASIAAAIAAASAGHSIFVAPGTYAPAGGTLTANKAVNLFARGATIDGAVAVTAGAYIEGMAVTGSLTYSGTVVASLVDCAIATNLVCSGALGHLYMKGGSVGGTVTVSTTASLDLVSATVTGLITLSGTGTLAGEWLTALAGITATAGATVRLVDSTVDDVDLSGGVCGFFATRTAFTSSVTYSGTGVGRLVDCHVAGAVTCDGVGAYLYLERTGVVGLLTVDGGAAQSTVIAGSCPLAALTCTGAGGFGVFLGRDCRFSGAILEVSGMAFLLDCFWSANPDIETQSGGVEVQQSVLGGLMMDGSAMTGTPFAVTGGRLSFKGVRLDHSGDTDIFTMTGGELNLEDCVLEGSRAAAMFASTGGSFRAKGCELGNANAHDAVIADLSGCGDVGLENVRLAGVLDCSGLTITATDVRYAYPGEAALIATAVNARRLSHRLVGTLEAGRTLLAAPYAAGAPINDLVGPWALVGGTMPFPATTISVLHSAGGGKAFTLYGTDAAGNAISETGITGIGVPVYTTRAFATITRFACEDPGGATTVDLQTGNGVFVGWDVLGVAKAAIEGELDTGTGAFRVETHVWAPTTLPAAAMYQIEAAV